MRVTPIVIAFAVILTGCNEGARTAATELVTTTVDLVTAPPTTIAAATTTTTTPPTTTTLPAPDEARAILREIDPDGSDAQIEQFGRVGNAVTLAISDPSTIPLVGTAAQRLVDIYASKLFRWQSVEPRIQALGGEWVQAFHQVRQGDEAGIDMAKSLVACAARGCSGQAMFDQYLAYASNTRMDGLRKLDILIG